MLRALLADRFKLEVHREAKQLRIHALVVAKGGPKFRELKPAQASCWPCTPKVDHLRYKDLPSLAAYLTRLGSWPGEPGAPVIDKTGLKGEFDLDVDISKMFETL